ncbi:SacI homology domain-containing protein [Mrakia frigida]|uniref:SacI homology domain-containing protein n=1 Tax=Mrakia frigida TaxID=29902 RepID=UPI003FCBF52A
MIPLWRRVDRRFWWNEWLGRELIDAGLHPFVLPVMQGWVQISTLHVPRAIAPPPTGPESSVEYETVPVEFIVISRRSRDRAGLRYQRRGLDDEGNVANFVESEMIVRAQSHVFSHVQTRGSIPLFWSQSPYSTTSNAYALKPAPVLDRPLPIARGPMAVHFDFLKEKYGDQTVINLSEATGKEALVTKGFEEVLLGLKRTDVDYQEFDFHHECKGMKFENVSILIDRLNDTFLKQSYFEAGGPDSQKLQSQNGAFRTNCIDCLDRTNVVQSALARHVLGIQLASIGLVQTADSPPSDIETVFNDVWANNGDAISRCYAGTSALKGDFTRTGKRNLQGMINDGLNSISRMYTSAFSDFFSQAVISFMLGQRSLAVFTEFVEKLQVAEPANLLRLAVVRSEAIETCSARVISEGETRQAGWTLFAPTEMGVTGGQQFEEKVLLLTAKALYVARYDYELEKVVGFTRIPLGNVVSLQKGVYILSPLQEAGQDPEENYGFKISFRGSDDETRLASYSMRNQIEPTPSTSPTKPRPKSSLRPLLLSSSPKPQPASILTNDSLDPSSDEIKFFAFKAIPRDVVLHGRELSVDREDAGGGQGDEKTCHEVVNGIVTRIRVLCSDAGSGWDGVDGLGGKFLREEAIISLAEAQSNTPFLARIEHGVKRWLWL